MKLFASISIACLASNLNAESISLTEENFDSTLEQYNDILVNFYSPWAVNWKSLQPHFEAAAPVLDASYPPYLVAKVNCNEEKVLCYKYTDSSGYPDPVFLSFKHRNAEEIESARNENIQIEEEFAKTEAESAEVEIENEESSEEDKKEEETEESEEKVEEESSEEKEKIAEAKRFKKMKLLSEKYIISDYKGGKTGPGIYRSLINNRENLNEIQDVDHFNKLMKAQVPVVIGFFDPEKVENKNKAPGFKAFSMAADQLNDYQQEKVFHVSKVRSYYTFSSEIMKAAGDAKIGTLVYYRPENDKEDFEERTEVYDKNGKFTKGLIRNFIRDNAMGLALNIRPDEKEIIGYPLAITIFDVEPKQFAKDSDEEFAKKVEISKNARNIVRKASRDLSKKYSMKFALGERMQFRDLMYDFKIKAHDSEFDDKFPFTVVFEDEWSKYIMTDNFTEENYRNFLHQHERREIKMYVKSEDDPINSPEEPITILTANNFDSHVNSGADLFIKFHAPWCGHCRRLAPYYEKMADMLLPSKPDLLISKMDIDANDLPPGFEVQGVPTMYFIPAGGKPVKYVESREPLEIIKWLEEHATVKPKMKSISELNIDDDVMAAARKRAEEEADKSMKEQDETNEIVDADIEVKDEL